VTVDLKEGTIRRGDVDITLVDLPGTYSLNAFSEEEVVARRFLLEGKPDVVVNILDASNIERNLYLTTQFIELGLPLVLALNMSDVAKTRGVEFDLDHLSALLGAPIVPTIGHKGTGVEQLLEVAVGVALRGSGYSDVHLSYGQEIETEIASLIPLIESHWDLAATYHPRWLALKLLEDDAIIRSAVCTDEIIAAAERSRNHLRVVFRDAPEIVIAERRYGFISGACQESVRSTVEIRHTLSDQIDAFVTNRLLGIPILLLLMWIVFQLTFTVGEIPTKFLEFLVGLSRAFLNDVLPAGMLRSLVTDGILGGLGGIIAFIPMIMLLFLALAVLEDSGYMARAAFVMDRVMHRIGLHGKSFIPMLLGFGCSVPAILATRTLETRRDRFVTMMIIPLMSCGARLPIYVLFCGAFFSDSARGYVVLALYILGILLAIAMAKVFRGFVFRGATTPLVMELPPYRIPTPEGVLIHTWERTWAFTKRVFTFLLVVSLIMWYLSNFPVGPDASLSPSERINFSYAGRVGRLLAVPLKPVGLGDWRVGTALFSGFAAKEVVVTTLGTLYNVADTSEESISLRQAIQDDPFFNPLRAFVLMVFTLIYLPCAGTFVAISRETKSYRWPVFCALYLTVLAWSASFLIYHLGMFLGIGIQ